MRQFQQQFIDRFVDVQVVLRRSLQVGLKGTWDQKLSSGSVLVTLMTIHLYQLRFADAEQYCLPSCLITVTFFRTNNKYVPVCCGFACLGWGKLTLTKKFLFGLKMAWDQELSSGLILLTFLTVLPFQFLSAVTEQSWLFTLTFPSGRRSSRLRIRVVSRFDVPHVHHHLYLPFSLRDGPCHRRKLWISRGCD